MLITEIKDADLRALAEKRREEYETRLGYEVWRRDTLPAAFYWPRTPEGGSFWAHVNLTGEAPKATPTQPFTENPITPNQ